MDENSGQFDRTGASRRAEDRTIATALGTMDQITRKWKPVVMLFATFLAGASALAAWLSVQNAIPNQITGIKGTMDSGFVALRVEVKTLHDDITENRGFADSSFKARNEQMELVLRILCPTLARPDLNRPCRPFLFPYADNNSNTIPTMKPRP